MVALAVQLQALGAEVALCAPPDEEFVELLARAGVPMVPFRRTWRSWMAAPSTAEERVFDADEYVRGHIEATYEPLANAVAGADLLVASGMLHFVAQTVAERAGVPHRFVVFAPVLGEVPQRDERVGPLINAHRSALGLPPARDVRRYLFTAHPWVAADPVLDQWEAPADLDVVRTTAWILPDERPLPPGLAAFLAAGPPPVYVGFGSMRMPAEIARTAIEAARAQGRRTVVARGWAELSLIDDREDCFAVGEVNQQKLFRRVAAVVHHGGAGTTATAALAGVPQVVVPQAADQPRWAGRVAELGIGVAHDGPVPTAESLSAALESAMAPETRDRAATVATTIRRDGAEVAARVLLG